MGRTGSVYQSEIPKEIDPILDDHDIKLSRGTVDILRDPILLEPEYTGRPPDEYSLIDWVDEMFSSFLDRTEEDVNYPSHIL